MRETCLPQELTITRKSLGLFWKGVTLNNLKRLLLKTLMGEFRIQNNTVDRFLIRSSPQAISSGSNVSTHFNVEILSIQNVGILELFTSLITFRHLYQGRKDGLKLFTPSFIKVAMPCPAYSALFLLQVVRIKKAALEFFRSDELNIFLKPKNEISF